LQRYGIACLENIGQIGEVRDMQSKIARDEVLQQNNIGQNMHAIVGENGGQSGEQNTLDQSNLLSSMETMEEREALRDKVKFGYSKDVLSLNSLLD